MARLIVWNVMSLDGCFEGRSAWDLEFHGTIYGAELEALSTDQLAGMELLVFGRKTYEGMANYWRAETGDIAERMNAQAKAVISNTLARADWNNTRLIRGEAREAIGALKDEASGDIYIFGSAELVAPLLAAKLVDEYRIGLAPIVLGGGAPLFRPMPEAVKMHLLEARALKTGAVLLRYQPQKG